MIAMGILWHRVSRRFGLVLSVFGGAIGCSGEITGAMKNTVTAAADTTAAPVVSTVSTASTAIAGAATTSTLTASQAVDPATPAKEGFVAIWSDEFNASKLNLTKWTYVVDGSGGGNNELEYYVPFADNSYLDNGKLVLHAIKKDYMAHSWTSAKITTQGVANFTYGYVEANIKIPTGQGFWPAFWMLPKDMLYGQWPTSGELDIMEILGGNPNTLYGTAHFGPPWPNQLQIGGTKKAAAGTDFSQDFHVYAMDWQADHVDWYLDGQIYFTMRATDGQWQTGAQGAPVSDDPSGWPFNKPFYIIFNLAVGGAWPGAPDAALTEGDLIVDYVRAYQRVP